MTACAYVVDNPELAEISAAEFIKRIGFTGIVDLDWRFDRRDGRYKLLDFNPRMGAQFRLFENEAGVDVVRAHASGPDRARRPGGGAARRPPLSSSRTSTCPPCSPTARSGYTHAARAARGRAAPSWRGSRGDDLLPFFTHARAVRRAGRPRI